MSSNALVIALCALSLGATCYLVASLPKADESRVAELEKKLEAADKRADAVEALRGEVRQLRERLDRPSRSSDDSSAGVSVPGVAVRAAGDGRSMDTASAATDGAVSKPIEDAVAERIEKKVAEKMEAMALRDKERGDDGKWKAPLDELSKELTLTDAQKADAKRIFDKSRDDAYALLKTMRLDGGCLLDDFVAALKGGADPGTAGKQFFARIFSEKIPGTDQTYLANFIAMTQEVEGDLGRHLDAGQMKRLKALRVSLLEVQTGYDPVGDYVRARLQ